MNINVKFEFVYFERGEVKESGPVCWQPCNASWALKCGYHVTPSHWQLYSSCQLVDTASTYIKTFLERSQDISNKNCHLKGEKCGCMYIRIGQAKGDTANVNGKEDTNKEE